MGNSRFKFRVWDKENKCMYYPTRYSNFSIVNGVIVKIESYLTGKRVYRGKRVAYEFYDAVLMQCTGLKDKGGKLIYEGDIIRFYFDNDEIIAVIEWDNDECRFYLNTTDFFKDKYVTDYEVVKQEEYEVIGNIYENKSLLESEG